MTGACMGLSLSGVEKVRRVEEDGRSDNHAVVRPAQSSTISRISGSWLSRVAIVGVPQGGLPRRALAVVDGRPHRADSSVPPHVVGGDVPRSNSGVV